MFGKLLQQDATFEPKCIKRLATGLDPGPHGEQVGSGIGV